MAGYSAEVERLMRRLFGSLRESDRRRYAAIEAAKLGHGGTEYIATVLDGPQDHPPRSRGVGG